MNYPHYRSIKRNYPTKAEMHVHPTQEQKILLRIEEIQRGRIGIYPHHVASSIASEFGVSLPEATNMVLQHIKNEMKGP